MICETVAAAASLQRHAEHGDTVQRLSLYSLS